MSSRTIGLGGFCFLLTKGDNALRWYVATFTEPAVFRKHFLGGTYEHQVDRGSKTLAQQAD